MCVCGGGGVVVCLCDGGGGREDRAGSYNASCRTIACK